MHYSLTDNLNMKFSGNSFEERNSVIRVLEHLFYELEFSSEKKTSIITEIAKRIPWKVPVYATIDELKDSSLRLTVRNYNFEIQHAMIEYHLGLLTQAGHGDDYRDLEKYVFLLSLLGDKNADYTKFSNELNRLSFRLGELFELNRAILTNDMRVRLLSRVLHEEEGFNGNQYFYHNPDNSYLTRVVETKFGIPISLSVVYMLVALRQKMPVYGVNLPLHFMVSFESPEFFTYIDPFNAGVLVDKETCLKFLAANGYDNSPEFFYKASTLSIIRRMYNNLLIIYRKQGDKELETILTKHISILEGKLQ
jgi:regulator of sirC expression with transglutaminase-like and TPR domain